MKKILLFIVFITLIAIVEVLCPYRGAGIAMGLALSFVGIFVGEFQRYESIQMPSCIFCFIFSLTLIWVLSAEVTIEKDEIRAPFTSGLIDSGDSIIKKDLKCDYIKYHDKYQPRVSTRYFLYQSDSVKIYDTYGNLLVVLPSQFFIKSQDLGHGDVDVICVGTKIFSCSGKEVDEQYEAAVCDLTPDYYINL